MIKKMIQALIIVGIILSYDLAFGMQETLQQQQQQNNQSSNFTGLLGQIQVQKKIIEDAKVIAISQKDNKIELQKIIEDLKTNKIPIIAQAVIQIGTRIRELINDKSIKDSNFNTVLKEYSGLIDLSLECVKNVGEITQVKPSESTTQAIETVMKLQETIDSKINEFQVIEKSHNTNKVKNLQTELDLYHLNAYPLMQLIDKNIAGNSDFYKAVLKQKGQSFFAIPEDLSDINQIKNTKAIINRINQVVQNENQQNQNDYQETASELFKFYQTVQNTENSNQIKASFNHYFGERRFAKNFDLIEFTTYKFMDLYNNNNELDPRIFKDIQKNDHLPHLIAFKSRNDLIIFFLDSLDITSHEPEKAKYANNFINDMSIAKRSPTEYCYSGAQWQSSWFSKTNKPDPIRINRIRMQNKLEGIDPNNHYQQILAKGTGPNYTFFTEWTSNWETDYFCEPIVLEVANFMIPRVQKIIQDNQITGKIYIMGQFFGGALAQYVGYCLKTKNQKLTINVATYNPYYFANSNWVDQYDKILGSNTFNFESDRVLKGSDFKLSGQEFNMPGNHVSVEYEDCLTLKLSQKEGDQSKNHIRYKDRDGLFIFKNNSTEIVDNRYIKAFKRFNTQK